MKIKLLALWESLRTSFWFLPMLLAMGAVTLSFLTVYIDALVTDQWLRSVNWVYAGGAEGASSVLAAIAGSMITITGLVFSLTLVALSLTSSQFGPRLLRNFMRDTSNQLVLGTFVATFLYCLLVLRTIRREDETLFVPHISVTIGVALSIASMVVLIYFIHHISVSIQADEIISRVNNDLLAGIDRLFPEKFGTNDAPKTPPSQCEIGGGSGMPTGFNNGAQPVAARSDGYIQYLDAERLLNLAKDQDFLLRLARRPGHYVVAGSTLSHVWPAEKLDEELAQQINDAFILGSQRTPSQDIEYAINQLVEVAVRALSPGINDPFTAMTCVDRLSTALRRIALREIPSALRYDEQGKLRVIAPSITFAGIVDAAFNQIRQYATQSPAVSIRLLEAIAAIIPAVKCPEDLATLKRHTQMIARSGENLPEREGRRAVELRVQEVLELCKQEEDAEQAVLSELTTHGSLNKSPTGANE